MSDGRRGADIRLRMQDEERPDSLVDRIDAALPQTQCTRCGYPDCRSYARAVAEEEVPVNQCPPGGDEGVRRLAALTGRPVLPLNPVNGTEGPLKRAVIDEDWCIGCTLCIAACPVDCIIGAAKRMHTVVPTQCTGCELCLPACPVDCIAMVDSSPGRSGWAAWSETQACEARDRYAFHRLRQQREREENSARLAAKAQAKLADLPAASRIEDEAVLQRKRELVEAALARARAKRG